MSAFPSINAAFALALASSGEVTGTASLETAAPNGGTQQAVATLLATLDPTRAAFASALLRIDVANAPQVAGPYVPGAAAGPLTENDIFDPSRLYSLPGQALAVFEEAATTGGRANVAASALPGENDTSRLRASVDAGEPGGGAFDNDVDRARPLATAIRSAPDTLPASRLQAEIVATRLDPRQPALTLELAVAGYMSLMKAGLSPTRRKILRKLKVSEPSWDADRTVLDTDEPDRAEADRKEGGCAPF